MYLQVKCHKLLCPFGSTPVNGACTSIALETHGLAVQTDYKLTLAQNKSNLDASAFAQANQESFGKAVFESFISLLSPRKGTCIGCGQWKVRSDVGSDIQDSLDVIISAILYTNERCQLDDIYAKAINVFSTEVTIALDEALSIDMTVHLDKRTYRETRKLPIIHRDSFESCSPMIRLNDERLCPEIQLKSRDLPPRVAGTVTVNTETPVEGTNFTLVTVCWEDYISSITLTKSFTTDSASARQSVMTTYITTTLLAHLASKIFYTNKSVVGFVCLY